MTGRVVAEPLKGAPVAKLIRAQVKDALAASGVEPHLVNVVVGEDEAAGTYLDAIDKLGARLGVRCSRVTLPAEADTAAVVAAVQRAGEDDGVHGLMIQSPLPRGIDHGAVVAAVPPRKDVDGVTANTLGSVLAGQPAHRSPATAAAVIELLVSDPRWDPEGKDVVIVGRSLVVGRPLAAMLAARGRGGQATVTLCHTATRDLDRHTRRADIVVVAAGRRAMLTADMIRPGAVVVDVGIHVTEDGLAGDADPAVAEVAAAWTPVPGGVGPVTNAVLMRHVAAAALPTGTWPPAW